MTDREKAIVMAYTGACMLTGDKFQIFHKYVEDIMGRSVWTHEMALDSIADEIRAKSKDDFIALCVDESRSEIPNTCSDAISRKYILDLIDTKGANLDDDLLIVEQWIQDAPSVNPHPIECGDAISRQAALDIITFEDKWLFDANGHNANTRIAFSGLESRVKALPSVTPQQRTGRCKDCKYFEYDSVAKVDGIPLIVAHEICKRWGDGCKSKEDGYCFLFEPKMQEV